MGSEKAGMTMKAVMRNSNLSGILDQIAKGCSLCGTCRKQCPFLQKNGLPGEMAKAVQAFGQGNDQGPGMAFECSLCGLCSALCPESLPLDSMFVAMRREAVSGGSVDFRRYARILGYERRGNSKTFSWYGLPAGCDTVFFPGCTLSGTRAEATFRLYRHLAFHIPALGVVLDCCNKPSHDLGRQEHFVRMFEDMEDWLRSRGVNKVIVACPNCYQVFQEYGQAMQVRMVWEDLEQAGLPTVASLSGPVTVHDPCPLRPWTQVHAAVRRILQALGLSISEMPHQGAKTFCCGEGGFVGAVNPDLAQAWTKRRVQEAGGRRIVTYCAGCAGGLGRAASVSHLADLVFWPHKALAGKVKTTKAPFTYLHRLWLKRRFQKTVPAVQSRERSVHSRFWTLV